MNKQIQDIEDKIFNEIDRLDQENHFLKQQIDQLNSFNMRIDETRKHVRIKEDHYNHDEEIAASNLRMEQILEDLNSTKTELMNTRDNCNSILNLDNKKMENVKSKFNKIKNYIETNEAQNASYSSSNDENDIIETKEHLDLLRYTRENLN